MENSVGSYLSDENAGTDILDEPVERGQAILAFIAAVTTVFTCRVSLNKIRGLAKVLIPGVSDAELQSALGALPPQPQLESTDRLACRIFSVSVRHMMAVQQQQQQAATGGAGGSTAAAAGTEAEVLKEWRALSEEQRRSFSTAMAPAVARLQRSQAARARPLTEGELAAELDGFMVATGQEQGAGGQEGMVEEDEEEESEEEESEDGEDEDGDEAQEEVGQQRKRRRVASPGKSLLQLLTATAPGN